MASSSKSTSGSRQSQNRSTKGTKGRAKATTKSNASSRSEGRDFVALEARSLRALP